MKIYSPSVVDWEGYYEFLCASRIMLITAREETFGYQVVDAVMAGCVPIAPNKFSYPELLPKQYLYDDKEELLIKMQWAFRGILSPLEETLVHEDSMDFYNRLGKLMI